MKRESFIIVLLALLMMPTLTFAQDYSALDRFEFGIFGGVGMYMGPNANAAGVVQVPRYTQPDEKYSNPGIETFGFSAGYRYDLRWQFKLQTMRQRVGFDEIIPTSNPNRDDTRHLYYNAMWHVDFMAEFNILRYGAEMHRGQSVYNIVPFVGLGCGSTFYNANATLRTKREGDILYGTVYPRVGQQLEDKNGDGKYTEVAGKMDVNAAMYIPVSTGVKWRINDNVQIKGTFQYNLYFQDSAKKENPTLNSNLHGGTTFFPGDKIYGSVVGQHHNFMLSLGAVVNFGRWDENLAKKNIKY